MAFSQKTLGPGEYEIVEEGQQQVLRINYLGVSFPPSIEHSKSCMGDVVEKIIQASSVSRVLLSADRNYIYGDEQTQMLREVANLYVYFTKQKRILSGFSGLDIDYLSRNPGKLASVQYVVSNLLRSDPIGAFVELKRMVREQKISLNRLKNPITRKEEESYLKSLIDIPSAEDKSAYILLYDVDGKLPLHTPSPLPNPPSNTPVGPSYNTTFLSVELVPEKVSYKTLALEPKLILTASPFCAFGKHEVK